MISRPTLASVLDQERGIYIYPELYRNMFLDDITALAANGVTGT